MTTANEDRDAAAASRDREARSRDDEADHRDADAEAVRADAERHDQALRDDLWSEERRDAADEATEANLSGPDSIAREVARGRAGLDRQRHRDILDRAQDARRSEAEDQAASAHDRDASAADRDAARADRDAARADRERAADQAEQAEVDANAVSSRHPMHRRP